MKIINLEFTTRDPNITIINSLNNNELLAFPSAPLLLNALYDENVYNALKNTDTLIPDSAYATLCYNIINSTNYSRISALYFLKIFFNKFASKLKMLFICPNEIASLYLKTYLKEEKLINSSTIYIAPMYNYNDIQDSCLLDKINSINPDIILSNIGGGIQEQLGLYLKKYSNQKFTYYSTGAAISFITNHQIKIPMFIDKIKLGWALRVYDNPSLYFQRYLKSFKLIKYIANTQKIKNLNIQKNMTGRYKLS